MVAKVSQAYAGTRMQMQADSGIRAETGGRRITLQSSFLKMEFLADINRRDAGTAPLHLAAMDGDVEIVKRLLCARADVQAKDSAGYAAVHIAAANNHPEILSMLLEHRVDVTEKARDGANPIHIAAALGRKDAMDALLNYTVAGAVDSQLTRDMPIRVIGNAITVTGSFPDGTRSVDLIELVDGIHYLAGGAPLHYACLLGHADMMRVLLDNAANANIVTDCGETSLCIACNNIHDRSDCVRVLIEYRADLDIKAHNGMSPLDEACFQEKHLVAEMLLLHGATTARGHLSLTRSKRVQSLIIDALRAQEIVA